MEEKNKKRQAAVGKKRAQDEQDIIDDAKREMFGDDSDFLDDDMGDK